MCLSCLLANQQCWKVHCKFLFSGILRICYCNPWRNPVYCAIWKNSVWMSYNFPKLRPCTLQNKLCLFACHKIYCIIRGPSIHCLWSISIDKCSICFEEWQASIHKIIAFVEIFGQLPSNTFTIQFKPSFVEHSELT